MRTQESKYNVVVNNLNSELAQTTPQETRETELHTRIAMLEDEIKTLKTTMCQHDTVIKSLQLNGSKVTSESKVEMVAPQAAKQVGVKAAGPAPQTEDDKAAKRREASRKASEAARKKRLEKAALAQADSK